MVSENIIERGGNQLLTETGLPQTNRFPMWSCAYDINNYGYHDVTTDAYGLAEMYGQLPDGGPNLNDPMEISETATNPPTNSEVYFLWENYQ